jgi:hypothetical protein
MPKIVKAKDKRTITLGARVTEAEWERLERLRRKKGYKSISECVRVEMFKMFKTIAM